MAEAVIFRLTELEKDVERHEERIRHLEIKVATMAAWCAGAAASGAFAFQILHWFVNR